MSEKRKIPVTVGKSEPKEIKVRVRHRQTNNPPRGADSPEVLEKIEEKE
ncbi:MAG: hypothetical protein R3251_03830 [Candidatus Spechtbacterales bacterium]|nr:hypothetical protein [Candidatus Spechtbacterales bacterium]